MFKFKSKRRLRLFYEWLALGGLFYVVDCLVVTYAGQTRPDLPWYERGIYAGGPAGILFTIGWLMFPLIRRIFKRINTRPRD